ncbi:MAG: type II secretion system protein [Patescibacteria group bacterium]
MEPAPFLRLADRRRASRSDARDVAACAPAGFTLVEMVVVLAIIGILTTITLLGQSTFNQSLLLTDTAYTMAFSAREAQSFGLSSRQFGGIQNAGAGYGLHFDRSLPGSYILFADISHFLTPVSSTICPPNVPGTPEQRPGNCRYDASGPADGTVETFTFSRGFTILRFCGKTSGSSKECSDDSSLPLTSLDIVFTRPNTSATISGMRASSLDLFSCAEVTVTDQTKTASKIIRLSQLGEISVGQTCP